MGASGSGNKSSSSGKSISDSSTYSSELSQKQLKILQQREKQYQDFFFPELKNMLAENSAGSAQFNAQVGANTEQVNAAFDANKSKIQQNLAQQGMLGQAGGVQAALTQANERARASALANAYAEQLNAANANKMNALQLGLAASPTPTTSAEYYQSSSSRTHNSSSGFGVGGEVKL